MYGKRILLFILVTVIASVSVYARGDREIEVVPLTDPVPQYISPGGDGVTDATLGFKVTLWLKIKDEEAYVPEYRLRILSEDGQIVNEDVYTQESPLSTFQQIFRLYREHTVMVEEVDWDGMLDSGEPAPDGIYTINLWIKDSQRRGEPKEVDVTELSGGLSFIVDSTAPAVEAIEPESMLLSPNGDGKGEIISLGVSLSDAKGIDADAWKSAIRDAEGNDVRVYDRPSGEPGTITSGGTYYVQWDGTTDEGEQAEPGIYSYYVYPASVLDPAENTSPEAEITGIELDPYSSDISLKVDTYYFSPNGDGVKDTITITNDVGNREKVARWGGSLVRVDNQRTMMLPAQEGAPPEALSLLGEDPAGNLLDEGFYSIHFWVEYANGFRAEYNTLDDAMPSFTVKLDVSAPNFKLKTQYPVFSPNGDGARDTNVVTIYDFDTAEIDWWRIDMYDMTGTIVYTSGDRKSTDRTLILRDPGDDADFSDGLYRIVATCTDLAGNTNSSEPTFVKMDVTKSKLSLKTDQDIISPNQDGRKDAVSVTYSSNESGSWTGTIVNEQNEEILKVTDSSTSNTLTWSGVDEEGEPVPDGTYHIDAEFIDEAGNKAEAPRVPVRVASEPISVSASMSSFGVSPNGDGKNDTIEIDIASSQYHGVAEWKIEIVSMDGGTVKTYTGEDYLPKQVVWDGSTDDGEPSEGLYTANLSIDYVRGDQLASRSGTFRIDVSPPRVDVAVTTDPFAKTEKGSIEGQVFLSLVVEDESEIVGWEMDVYDTDDTIVRSYSGPGNPSEQIAWQGEIEGERVVDDGNVFELTLIVSDVLGNTTEYSREVPLDILLVMRDGKMYLMVPNIIFGAYQHELDSAGSEMEARNYDSLERVVTISDKYPNYDLGLEGHALNVFYGKDPAMYREEEEILFPLTERRAGTVEEALVELGIPDEKITWEAFGGRYPIAPTDDPEVWWKNRRVEFLMVPPK